MTVRDLPNGLHITKIPQEKFSIGVFNYLNDLDDWDFIYVQEDYLGNPLKIWGSMYAGDRWNTPWQSDQFDYELIDKVTLLWDKKGAIK